MTAWHIRAEGLVDANAGTREFIASLRDALTWCATWFSMWELESSLRTPELRPPELDDDDILGSPNATVVARLVAKRRELLSQEQVAASGGARRVVPAGLHPRFHLLCVYPGESTWDGTSPPPTGGFLNDADEAAWDTWIAVRGDAVISLVPDELVSAVQVAIEVNALQCVDWFGERDDAAWRELRAVLAPAASTTAR